MTAVVHLIAPAKLNLYLRVVGRRPDGYHELETLFERLDLSDELTFEDHPSELHLSCPDPSLSCGADNLILKAARLLQQHTGTARGARIHLTKRIPIAAGLGGGSSDAATTLVGLNRLWNTGCSASELLELAARLGSDVPFFLCGHSFSVGRGRGELLEPVMVTTMLNQVLVTPKTQLSTQEVFREAQFSLTASKPSITILLHALRNGSLGELAKGFYNDLQPEAIRRCPVMTEIHAILRAHGCLATLASGSGPSVFGLCHDAPQATRVARQVRERGSPDWFIQVVRTDDAPLMAGWHLKETARGSP